MPTTAKKTEDTDKSGKTATAVAEAPSTADAVTTAKQKLDEAKAAVAEAEAAHAQAVEDAKPKIGRWDPKQPTILVENGGEQAVSLDAFSDKENGHDFRVGDYIHCANLDLSDDKGPHQRWVYRKVASLA
jgi:hypothetical protein